MTSSISNDSPTSSEGLSSDARTRPPLDRAATTTDNKSGNQPFNTRPTASRHVSFPQGPCRCTQSVSPSPSTQQGTRGDQTHATDEQSHGLTEWGKKQWQRVTSKITGTGREGTTRQEELDRRDGLYKYQKGSGRLDREESEWSGR